MTKNEDSPEGRVALFRKLVAAHQARLALPEDRSGFGRV